MQFASSRLTLWILIAILGLDVFVASITGYFLLESRAQYVEKAAITAKNLSQLLAQQFGASLRQIDISLRAMGDVVVQGLAADRTLPEQKLSGLLVQHHARLPEIDRLLVVDARGQSLAGAGFGDAPTIDVSNRDYFHRLRDDPYSGMIVGRPVLGKQSDKQIIPFVRRISNPDGSFAGALIVIAEVGRFARALAEIDVGARADAFLLDADFQLIAQRQGLEEAYRHDPDRDQKIGAMRAAFPPDTRLDGTPRVATPDDAEHMLSVLKSADWPFHVGIDLPAENYLAAWRRDVGFSLAILLTFFVATFVTARLLLVAWRTREATEAKLMRALRFNDALLESIPIPVYFKDVEGRYLGCNPAYSEILGVTPEQMRDKTAADLWPADLAATYLRKDRELLANHEPSIHEADVRDKHGEIRRVLFARNVFRDEHQAVAGIIGTFIDITERKCAEREIQAARLAAESASRAKSAFLATMSHELRTPMNGILGMAQLLLMPDINAAERQEFARTILNSGQTLLTLLNDILDLSKVEAGKLDIVHAVFEPHLVIAEIALLFAETANAKGLAIETSWQGAEGQRYRADPVRLRQMLSNLVNNAIKFTAHGFVRLTGTEIERDGNIALLEFAVEDSGIGITPEKQALLFKPFSQVDASTTRKYGGTGLGLSIVLNLARLMGGEAGVASDLGKGARFWFRIRAELVSEAEESRHARRDDTAVAPPDASAQGAPALSGQILVVEDNPTNCKLVVALLRKLGLPCDCLENGQEAVDAILDGMRPDLVLMDVQMPVMDGIQATEYIRRWEATTSHDHLPIVALTAGVFAEDRARCLEAGMDEFLTKPVNLNELTAVLRKWLGKRS